MKTKEEWREIKSKMFLVPYEAIIVDGVIVKSRSSKTGANVEGALLVFDEENAGMVEWQTRLPQEQVSSDVGVQVPLPAPRS